MTPITFALCAFAVLYRGALAVTVFEALQSSNAGLFAQWVEQDPGLAPLYNSSQVQTVFAPVDEAFQAFNQSGKLSSLRRLLVRQSLPSDQGQIQACHNANLLNGQSAGDDPLGRQLDTLFPSSDPGRTQPVITPPPSNSGNGTSSKRKRQHINSTTQSFHFYSGLGNSVSVVQADILYDGGVIHTLDGFVRLSTFWLDFRKG